MTVITCEQCDVGFFLKIGTIDVSSRRLKGTAGPCQCFYFKIKTLDVHVGFFFGLLFFTLRFLQINNYT